MRFEATSTLFAAASAVSLFAASARADGWEAVWLPGPARAIPRTTSASRDTPLLEWTEGYAAAASLGLEPGLVSISRGGPEPTHELHLGLYGMAALENQPESSFLPHDYWRGLVGVTFTYAPLGLSRHLFGPGSALELGFVIGHESDHRTDMKPGLSIYDQTAIFQDFIGGDLGFRVPLRRLLTVVARFSHHLNPGQLFTQAGSTDLELRLVAFQRVQPFVAMYGQVLFTSNRTPNCPSARALTGVALPGRFGEVSAFASFEGGCDEGLLYGQREFRPSGGLRYTPF